MPAKRARAIRRSQRVQDEARRQTAASRRALLFTRKFLLAATVAMVLISIIPESWFEPLNRLTVRWVTELLRAGGQTPVARQTFIGLDGFRVKVIAECAAVHLAALLAAFVFAFPATRGEKWIGTGTGIVFLFSVNILRIALVTLIGRYFPDRFEIAHVYLGQLGMLLVTMAICLVWCRWVNNTERMHGPFILIVRFLIFSSVPFLLWIPLNRIYVGLIDRLIAWLFGLVSLRLMIPLSHTLYYQTFSLVALFVLNNPTRRTLYFRRRPPSSIVNTE